MIRSALADGGARRLAPRVPRLLRGSAAYLFPCTAEAVADGAGRDSAVGMADELAAPDQVVHALAADPQHGARNGVGDALGSRVADAPCGDLPHGCAPPAGRRVEGF